jgi:hypothetical protein
MRSLLAILAITSLSAVASAGPARVPVTVHGPVAPYSVARTAAEVRARDAHTDRLILQTNKVRRLQPTFGNRLATVVGLYLHRDLWPIQSQVRAIAKTVRARRPAGYDPIHEVYFVEVLKGLPTRSANTLERTLVVDDRGRFHVVSKRTASHIAGPYLISDELRAGDLEGIDPDVVEQAVQTVASDLPGASVVRVPLYGF